MELFHLSPFFASESIILTPAQGVRDNVFGLYTCPLEWVLHWASALSKKSKAFYLYKIEGFAQDENVIFSRFGFHKEEHFVAPLKQAWDVLYTDKVELPEIVFLSAKPARLVGKVWKLSFPEMYQKALREGKDIHEDYFPHEWWEVEFF